MTTVPMSGRRAQAARNDEVILDAARDVFVADPGAPIAAVAQKAGVGISALYRRYPSKEELLSKLCLDGLLVYVGIAEQANAELDAGADPAETFTTFMRRIVDADTHSLTQRLAGTFHPTQEHNRNAVRAGELNQHLVDRLLEAEVVRPDLAVADLGLVFEMIAAIRFGDDERRGQLRHRYLALLLAGLLLPEASPLPGPAPYPGEFAGRWIKTP
ncbi:TetR/AcrR family transcriptional regulator [Asanoa sp. WMMD1127]|uniref:TetR/AcrR family transcriptional regulator n=1 Tax=Asanoa sp. WMMD1127 TaxID=3016107 RepID=UPI0024170FA3|nr:TetR/AcrR family transcriptional regulator [Asanoa sp. WMMD1127]MDG4822562.1 TetR/AcrR family transcriptional regulator [Asanoa sp. WMMD1127]